MKLDSIRISQSFSPNNSVGKNRESFILKEFNNQDIEILYYVINKFNDFKHLT